MRQLHKSLDFWWPHIHRDVLLSVNVCKETTNAGKTFKHNQSQGPYDKLLIVENVNDQNSRDFAGMLKIATST